MNVLDSIENDLNRGAGLLSRIDATLDSIDTKMELVTDVVAIPGGREPPKTARDRERDSEQHLLGSRLGSVLDRLGTVVDRLHGSLGNVTGPSSRSTSSEEPASGTPRTPFTVPDTSAGAGLLKAASRMNDMVSGFKQSLAEEAAIRDQSRQDRKNKREEQQQTQTDRFKSVVGSFDVRGAFDKADGFFGSMENEFESMGRLSKTVMPEFVGVMVGSIDKLRKWTNQIQQANLQFAQFSPSMAALQMQMQFRQMQIDRERGERRYGSAKSLAEEQLRFEQDTAPAKDLWGNMINSLGASFMRATNDSPGMKWLRESGIIENANAFFGYSMQTNRPQTFGEFADEVARDRRTLRNEGAPGRWQEYREANSSRD